MQLTADQVAQYAKQAGFKGSALVTAIAVCYQESRFETTATNGQYLGLWQIGTLHLPYGTSPTVLYNPLTNAQYAYKVSSGGTNWNPWTSYTSGAYKQFLAMATDAAYRVLGPTYPPVKVLINNTPVPAIGVPQGTTSVTYVSVAALNMLGVGYTSQGGNVYVLGGSRYLSGITYNGQVYIPWNEIPGISSPTKIPGGWSFTDAFPALAAIVFASYGLIRATAG